MFNFNTILFINCPELSSPSNASIEGTPVDTSNNCEFCNDGLVPWREEDLLAPLFLKLVAIATQDISVNLAPDICNATLLRVSVYLRIL